jgi:hypothetical protein
VRTVAVLCAVALGIAAQTPAPEDATLLQRIRTHMMEMLASQPNYTCLETVERTRRNGAAGKFELQDTLRVEVALVNGKEMFAWPGAKQFEDKDLRQFIPSGMFGTGDFALHAKIVFGTNLPTFERGESTPGDRATVRFDFKVQRVRSGFRVRNGDVMLPVGYHGSFYADPLSLDVRRLEIVADDIPAALKLSQISDTMDYAPVPIGNGDFLLPAASDELMVDSDGQAHRNRLEFTSCRQFTGQSVLSFTDPGPVEPAPKIPEQELKLPPNLELTLRLAKEIDLDKAGIGDSVRAVVDTDVKLKKQIVLPKGAIATGRISRMERHPDFIVVGFVFSDVEAGSAHTQLDLIFDRLGATVGPTTRFRNVSLNAPVRGDEALVILPSGSRRLSQGILMFWRT